jgi:DICT domain-containing protein
MWESRHGFPSAVRLSSGRRTYTEADVAAVSQVRRWRDQGLSLSAAIARVRAEPSSQPGSVFAALRRRRADLQPMLLRKPAMVALSRAIEDEYSSHGQPGVLIGSFQRERFYRQSTRRWRELARTSKAAVALADFAGLRTPDAGPTEVPVPRENPLSREWTLLVRAPDLEACLAGWERATPTPVPDGARTFEVVWSFDPEVVQTALEALVDLVGTVTGHSAVAIPERLLDPPGPSPPELRSAGWLAQRTIGYLARGAAEAAPQVR